MNIITSIIGSVTVELTSADIPGCISELNSAGVILQDVRQTGVLTACFDISRIQFKKTKRIVSRKGSCLRILKRIGLYWDLKRLYNRPVLLLGVGLVFVLGLYLPTRVLFLEVSGNTSVPSGVILEAVQRCGVRFGASRKTIRSEIIKNQLLSILPQLQWVGINTRGCTAMISVSERKATELTKEQGGVCSIVAVTDGIIQSYTATKGNPLCKVGQAVKKGQVLISGYTDCGLSIQATRAEGEIFALTNHAVSVICPTNCTEKSSRTWIEKKYSIIFGKKRINLSKNSRIPMDRCDKIYAEYPLVLPGGFVLPVALAVEIRNGYTETEVTDAVVSTKVDLSAVAQEYLAGRMISGSVMEKSETVSYMEDFVQMNGQYSCMEMIGRVRYEEILDGKDH